MCADMPQFIQIKQNGFADPEPSRLKAEFPLALRVSPNIRSKDFVYIDAGDKEMDRPKTVRMQSPYIT